jgi:prepilin-type N-terminal cleavage/methylation domain-containing protein
LLMHTMKRSNTNTNMKKGLTLVETLVGLVIVLVLFVLVYSFTQATSSNSEDIDYTFLNPQVETARSQRRIAEEMQRQNDLLQRRLELLEQKNVEKEH